MISIKKSTPEVDQAIARLLHTDDYQAVMAWTSEILDELRQKMQWSENDDTRLFQGGAQAIDEMLERIDGAQDRAEKARHRA